MTETRARVCLVLVTHNRVRYTEKCAAHLLADTHSEFVLHIWDNASTDDTASYLKSLRDPRIREVIFWGNNAGQTVAMNRVWAQTSADFVAKIDNDCLVTPGWTGLLAAAHRDNPDLGAIACWHYREEDFEQRIAQRKIRQMNKHAVFEHPFVCGSGFMLKRETYLKMGPWPEGSADIGTTGYFLRLAQAGYVNGWYFPLILQHHMDDPLSPYCSYHDDKSLQEVRDVTFTLRNRQISTMDQRMRRRRLVLENLMYGAPKAACHVGWRGKMRRVWPRVDRLLWRVGWII